MRLRVSVAAVTLALFALIVSVLIGVAQERLSVAGEWHGTLTRAAGSVNITLTLSQDGEKVSGISEVSGSTVRGHIRDKVEGVLEGVHLSLKNLSVAHGYIKAAVEGDSMRGTYVGGSGYQNELVSRRVRK